MVRMLLTLLAGFVIGCGPSMKLQVSPTPTLGINTTSVAVVSDSRECRDIADALVSALRDDYGFRIQPSAPIRLTVGDCSASYETKVTITQAVDPLVYETDQRKVAMVGRAHASLTVSAFGEAQARSIGTGRQEAVIGRHADNLITLKRLTESSLHGLVADDLASQVSPVPKQVARRIYPNASDRSARGLHTLAVRAEAQGYLARALEYAQAAHERRPTKLSRAYVADLNRRVQHSERDPNR